MLPWSSRDPQRRTLDQLIGTEPRPSFPADLPQRLRDRIEEAVRGLELREPLWLGKAHLTDHDRCEGSYLAKIQGEAPPFMHSSKSAAGVLLHKAIEVEVGSRDHLEAWDVASVAAQRVVEREERFDEYWRELGRAEQDEVLMEVMRRVELFRGTFPPLKELRRELAPISELRVRAELAGGDLTLTGQIDLVLGAPDRTDPMRATRLAIDLKTGERVPGVRRGHAVLRPAPHAAVRRAAVPRRVALPRVGRVAGRGRLRGLARPGGRPRDRGGTVGRGASGRARALADAPGATAAGAHGRPSARRVDLPAV